MSSMIKMRVEDIISFCLFDGITRLDLCHGFPCSAFRHHLSFSPLQIHHFYLNWPWQHFPFHSLSLAMECWWHTQLHNFLICCSCPLSVRAWAEALQKQNTPWLQWASNQAQDYFIFITSIKTARRHRPPKQDYAIFIYRFLAASIDFLVLSPAYFSAEGHTVHTIK